MRIPAAADTGYGDLDTQYDSADHRHGSALIRAGRKADIAPKLSLAAREIMAKADL